MSELRGLLPDVQGWILRGYRMPVIRHVVLGVADAGRARRWLGDVAGGDPSLPQVTTAEPWTTKPDTMLNVGITHAGLVALGVGAGIRRQFPVEFRDGMAAQAVKLGDVGDSDPRHWLPSFRDADALHLIVSIHALDAAGLDRVTATLPTGAFVERSRHDGAALPGDRVHFGYRDSISQPRFAGLHDEEHQPDEQPFAPLGTVLLGHPTAFEEVRWIVPEGIGHNGAFDAFRILAQDVSGFERFLDDAAETLLGHPAGDRLLPAGWQEHWPDIDEHAAMVEIVAAKVLGRWRTGNSLETDPSRPGTPRPLSTISRFDYVDDFDGQRCPIGSHVRRNNPRGATVVQRNSNHTRRIIRRGTPYGPELDRSDGAVDDGVERGLLGNFICASLSAQFEALQYDWLNLGMQDPRITGKNDVLLGANDADYSSFEFPVGEDTVTLRGFPRFVTVRGGAYTFLPSIGALRRIAGLR